MIDETEKKMMPNLCGVNLGMDMALKGFTNGKPNQLERAVDTISTSPRAKEIKIQTRANETAEYQMWQIMHGFYHAIANDRINKFKQLPYRCMDCPFNNNCYERNNECWVKK